MVTWEVLLTDGQVHLVSSIEPAVGEDVVRFWNLRNELVATYVLRNLFGWRQQSDGPTWTLR